MIINVKTAQATGNIMTCKLPNVLPLRLPCSWDRRAHVCHIQSPLWQRQYRSVRTRSVHTEHIELTIRHRTIYPSRVYHRPFPSISRCHENRWISVLDVIPGTSIQPIMPTWPNTEAMGVRQSYYVQDLCFSNVSKIKLRHRQIRLRRRPRPSIVSVQHVKSPPSRVSGFYMGSENNSTSVSNFLILRQPSGHPLTEALHSAVRFLRS